MRGEERGGERRGKESGERSRDRLILFIIRQIIECVKL